LAEALSIPPDTCFNNPAKRIRTHRIRRSTGIKSIMMKKQQKPFIRELKPEEIPLLEDMLYEAIWQPDENSPVPKSVLKIPQVEAYIKDFGSWKDDCCLVAELDGKIAGAVWVRVISGIIKGYGYVDGSTPELAISLFREYRNRGIGSRLLSAMIKHLRESGYKQTSLNVKKKNDAVKLYRRMGFEIIGEDSEDYLMLLKLNEYMMQPADTPCARDASVPAGDGNPSSPNSSF
jgi:ribosomal protein S18 acetylase RimI-like enzyme